MVCSIFITCKLIDSIAIDHNLKWKYGIDMYGKQNLTNSEHWEITNK